MAPGSDTDISTLGQRLPRDIGTPGDDGPAFRLTWDPVPPGQTPQLSGIPPTGDGLSIFHTVTSHLGYLSLAIDEARFVSVLEAFGQDPVGVARSQRLWLVEYLVILALGEALANGRDDDPPPGATFAARALALLPDLAQLHQQGLAAVEALCLVGLYLQSIGMRVDAYLHVRTSHAPVQHRLTDPVDWTGTPARHDGGNTPATARGDIRCPAIQAMPATVVGRLCA